MPSIRAQTDYWHLHPPVHLLVAAYLGYQPNNSPASGRHGQNAHDAAVEALIAMAPQLPDHLKPNIPGYGRH